jgi:putative transposase
LGKLGFDNDWLLPHPLYDALGRDADRRRQAYRRLLRAAMNETDLKAIRDSLHKGWVLDDDRFREQIALLSERRAAPLRKRRPRKNKEWIINRV